MGFRISERTRLTDSLSNFRAKSWHGLERARFLTAALSTDFFLSADHARFPRGPVAREWNRHNDTNGEQFPDFLIRNRRDRDEVAA
jgi:hypothetical protein